MLASLWVLQAHRPRCIVRAGKRLPAASSLPQFTQASSLAEEIPWGAQMPAPPAIPSQGRAGLFGPYSLGHSSVTCFWLLKKNQALAVGKFGLWLGSASALLV